MPAAPRRRPGEKSAHSELTYFLPRLAVAIVLTISTCSAQQTNTTEPRNNTQHINSKQSHVEHDVPSRTFELISTSGKNKQDISTISDSDLPAATKQYEYSLLRPYGPILAYPGRPPSPGWPSVEILNHHRDPPFVTHKPSQHLIGSPMLSTVVVQDMSQSVIPRPPITMDSSDTFQSVDHHLGPNKIPFTDVKVETQPLYGNRPPSESDLNFTDKLEESDLSDESAANDNTSTEDEIDLLENPPHLDVGSIVEDALKDVFKDEKILRTNKEDLPAGPWPCTPVTCCTKPTKTSRRKCSSVVQCSAGRRPPCPERLPQALALSSRPPPSEAKNTTDKADVRDGEPRFKKKKIIKKKKKFLKKFMLPLLLAYKLLFLLILPLLVNGMMMMMSSSGMAGFFFALIGASVAMVRVYTGSMSVIPAPPPNKVVKVVKYVQAPPPPPPPPPPVQPTVQPTLPPPTPAPTTPMPAIVHHQPFVEEHFPPYHAPPPPPPPIPPPYGNYYPHPYMTRYYDRSGAFEGGRKKKRRRKDSILLDDYDFDRTLANFSRNGYWLSE